MNSQTLTTILSVLLSTSYCLLIFSKTTYESIECIQYARERLLHPGNRIEGVFFVPDDPVKKILIGLIYNEKSLIKAALYQLTDNEIVNALIDARKRGVMVEVITDKSCLLSKHEKISTLKRHGIAVYVYNKAYSIMHNKIWVFGRNFYNRPLLLSGSANATMTGTTRNEENVIVTDRFDIVRIYNQKLDRLKHKIITMHKSRKKKGAKSSYEWFLYTVKTLALSASR